MNIAESLDALDDTLLERWKNGDTDAGHALCTRHYKTVHRFFRKWVRADDDANDLTQKTFLGVMAKVHEIRDFKRFLYTVRSRRLKDYIRSKQRGVGPDEPYQTRAGERTGMETMAERNQRKDAVHKALCELRPERYEVLWLHYADGLSAPQIAALLEAKEGTVKSRLRLGREDLARTLRSLKTGAPTLQEIFRITRSRRQEKQ